MSVPRGKGQNGGHFYSNITQPMKLDCQFVVNASDSAGKGITSLKSNGYVQSVFMHTSATPATGSPNPAAGNILVVFNNNFNKFLGCLSSLQSPLTGSPLTATVNHVAYQITALGSATAAQWVTAGLPSGFTAALGQGFIAKTTGTIGGSATVKAISSSGIDSVELVGSVNGTISNSSIATNGGAQAVLQCLADGVLTAPADGTTVNLSFFFDSSSVTIDGL